MHRSIGRRSTTALAALFATAGVASTQTNVLLIVGDDMGVDSLGMYQEASDYPITPVLDALYGNGVLFRNVWSNPNCSPSRALMMTGRYGFRTGIGDHIPDGTSYSLPLEEVTLAEMLDLAPTPYASGAFGKWHLGNDSVGGWLAPNLAGFDHFDGSSRNSFEVPPPPNWVGYYRWPRIVDGAYSVHLGYATSTNVDSALSWIQAQSGPWLCNLWLHAPHAPYHSPPAALISEDLSGLDPTVTPRPFYKAAIEAMDAEIGRLLGGLGPELANTLVIFVGDNGTPNEVAIPPIVPGRAKGSIYEGGVNVPLIVSGPQVVAAETRCAALVDLTDVFATIAEVAGVDLATAFPETTFDGVSLLPYLADPTTPSIRTHVFAERFKPNGIPNALTIAPATTGGPSRPTRVVSGTSTELEEATHVAMSTVVRAVRDDRYKLVVGARNELFDLALDPLEATNLLDGTLTAGEQSRYRSLAAHLRALLSSR